MTIERTTENGSIRLAVNGELTALTSDRLSVMVKEAIDETDNLVLDFAGLEYVASAGLRVLLEARKLLDGKNGKLTVCNVSGPVMNILEITGLNDILTIE